MSILNSAVRSLACSLAIALPAASQVTIRLDPAEGTAIVTEWEPGTPLSPVSYETILPDGEVAEGVWDLHLSTRFSHLQGVRVTAVRLDEETDKLTVEFTRIDYFRGFFPCEADTGIRVPEEFLLDPSEHQLELAWYGLTEPLTFEIGTAVSDDNQCTLPLFTKLSSGVIEPGLWQENTSGVPVYELPVLFASMYELNEDGVPYFQSKIGHSVSTHVSFKPGYLQKVSVEDHIDFCELAEKHKRRHR